jgi:hypothetical protein
VAQQPTSTWSAGANTCCEYHVTMTRMPPSKTDRHVFGGRKTNPVPTVTRSVIVSAHCKRRQRLWAFGYADLSRLLGVTEDRVRNMVCDNTLDPGDLEQVCRAWAARRGA